MSGIAMDHQPRSVPAPRKDLSRKRRKSTSAAATTAIKAMDIESLIATLTEDDNAVMEPPQTQVHYYTYAEPKTTTTTSWEPRLLIRQAYKVASEACLVVGLECVRDFKPSIYLVSNQTTVSLTFEDLISLRSPSVISSVDRHLTSPSFFKPLYLNTVVVDGSDDGGINITNYHIKGNISSCWNRQMGGVRNESDVIKDSCGVLLHVHGWNSLKRNFDCIESYYSICAESSATVQYLMSRYARFLTKHYRTEAFLSGHIVATKDTTSDMSANPISLDPELVRRITADIPLFLQDLNEKRLPIPDAGLKSWYQPTPLRLSLLTWLDSEVRRYCAPNLIESVLDNIKYHLVW